MAVNGIHLATGTDAAQPSLATLPLEAQPPDKVPDPALGIFGRWRRWLMRLWPAMLRGDVRSAQAHRMEPASKNLPVGELSARTAPDPASDVDAVLRQLARRALGYTGADIERLVREARQKARREQRSLSFSDLDGLLSASRPTITLTRGPAGTPTSCVRPSWEMISPASTHLMRRVTATQFRLLES